MIVLEDEAFWAKAAELMQASGRSVDNLGGPELQIEMFKVLSHNSAKEFLDIPKSSDALLLEPEDVLPRSRRHCHRNGGPSTKGFGFRVIDLIHYSLFLTPRDLRADLDNILGTTSAHGLKKVK